MTKGESHSNLILGIITIFVVVVVVMLVLNLQKPEETSIGEAKRVMCKTFEEVSGIFYADDAWTTTENLISAADLSDEICSEDTIIFYNSLQGLLIQRKEALVNLITEDYSGRVFSVPSLPEEVKNLFSYETQKESIEEYKEFVGELTVFHMDDFENPENSKFEFYLKTEEKTYQLFSETALPVIFSGAIVSVHGLAVDDVISIRHPIRQNNLGITGNVVSTGITATTGVTLSPFKIIYAPPNPWEENLGVQKTLVIVAGIGNDPPPLNVSEAESIVFGYTYGTAQDFYLQNSYQKLWLEGKVVGPYTLPASTCRVYEIDEAAIEAADPDVYYPEYDRIIFYVPITACFFGGVGTVGKTLKTTADGDVKVSLSWVGVYYPTNYPVILAHELGHNFGALHANYYICYDRNNRVSNSLFCESSEYGDRYSVMGSNAVNHNNLHKEDLGWLNNANSITVTEGTYFLKSSNIKLPAGEIQQIRLPLEYETNFFAGSDDLYYSLEFRSLDNYDSKLNYFSPIGVLVRIGRFVKSSITAESTQIIDMGLSRALPPHSEEPLMESQEFIDELNGYKIKVLSVQSDGALVNIESIPKTQIDFSKPVVYFDGTTIFEPGPFNWYAVDNARYLKWARIYGKDTKETPGKEGGFYFDGVDDFIRMGALPHELATERDELTISAWIKIDALPTSNYEKTFIYYGGYSNLAFSRNLGFIFGADYMDYYGPAYALVYTNQLPNVGEWHHIVGTLDKNEIAIYIDGIKKASQSLSATDIPTGYRHPFVSLGSPSEKYPGKLFNGIMDEVNVYARKLSDNEILNIYNSFCVDSDGGRVYSVPGTTTSLGTEESYTDKCESGRISTNILREYFCKNHIISSELHSCKGKCRNGACA